MRERGREMKERRGRVGWDELGMEGKRRGERRRYGRKKKRQRRNRRKAGRVR